MTEWTFGTVAAAVVMAAGALFNLLGCIGLVRLPDVYNRVQASTKCVTLGTLLLLTGVIILFGFGSMGVKALVCLWFVAMTSPTAAHAIGRAAHRSGIRLWEKSVCDEYAKDREGAVEAPAGSPPAEEVAR
ncbi:MAG: monovalent cation/H(+) antiporter subunit G [Planctomycetes bacterium]|jgi:multicomponent Na+:H+ antiporter subunit G|nr:monovalent cation/H(+) antiporter subunit G [Planctomycetota bacterium]